MKTWILTFAALSTSAFANTVIGDYKLNGEFASHTPRRADAAGMPERVYVQYIKVIREGSELKAQVAFKTKASDYFFKVVTAKLHTLAQTKTGTRVQVLLAKEGESETCGKTDERELYLTFEMVNFGQYGANYSLVGTRTIAADNCHDALMTEEYQYSLD